ncbi:MAG: porin family protein [Alphaproteobacteria bacterium]|nr:porin family protein [Alphaproteobacteria bacterium]
MKKFITATAFIAAFMAVSRVPAVAQNYIGLSAGFTSYDDTGADIESQGLTFFAGGQFDPLLAVEFSYTAIADVETNGRDSQASVLALSGVLRSPGEGFEPFLRLGIARGDGKVMGGGDSYDEEKTGVIYGFGADFTLNYNSSLRFEYVETDLDGAETDRLSFGTIYRF